jgi:hypothetical protein
MINRKKTQRLYREEGLAVGRRRSRRRAVGTLSAGSGVGPREPALEPGLRSRPDGVGKAVPRAQHRRRCDQRVPAGGAGHIDLGSQGRARADRADREARQARA